MPLTLMSTPINAPNAAVAVMICTLSATACNSRGLHAHAHHRYPSTSGYNQACSAMQSKAGACLLFPPQPYYHTSPFPHSYTTSVTTPATLVEQQQQPRQQLLCSCFN
jgi:hypothetical protein